MQKGHSQIGPSLCDHRSLNLQNCALRIPSLIDLDVEESREKTKNQKGRNAGGEWLVMLFIAANSHNSVPD